MFMNYMQGGGGSTGRFLGVRSPPPPAKYSVLVLGLLMPCASIKYIQHFVIIVVESLISVLL